MRWFGAVIGLLVFVLLVMIGVGTALPVTHEATCAADIPAPRGAVWIAVSDPTDSGWRSDIASVIVTSSSDALRPAWTERDRNGQSIPYERVETKPQERVVNRIAGNTLPFGGTWTLSLTPSPHGTRLAILEDGQIYNPIFRLLSRYAIGYTSRMQQYLGDLQRHFGGSPNVACESPTGD